MRIRRPYWPPRLSNSVLATVVALHVSRRQHQSFSGAAAAPSMSATAKWLLWRKAPTTPRCTSSSEVKTHVDSAVSAQSSSAFYEAVESLLSHERKRLYAFHRPHLSPTPRDYVSVFERAAAFHGTVESFDHCVTVQLLQCFFELWMKPVDMSRLRLGDTTGWSDEGDQWLQSVVVAAVASFRPSDGLLAVQHVLIKPLSERLRNPPDAQPRQFESQPSPTDLESPDESVREILSTTRRILRGEMKDVKEHRIGTLIRLARTPQVVGCVASCLVSIRSPGSKEAALDILDEYFVSRIGGSEVSDADEHSSMITTVTEAAAVAGDSELVTRLIFLLFRYRGLIGIGPVLAEGSSAAAGPRGLMSKLFPTGSRRSDKTTTDVDVSFDKAVARLLGSSIKACCRERGTSEAHRLFDVLRSCCTPQAVAAMGLEMLAAYSSVWKKGGESLDVDCSASLPSKAFEVLSRMASVYPLTPTEDDEKWMGQAVALCMSLHCTFVSLSSLSHSPIVVPVVRSGVRVLELFDRLPARGSARSSTRLMACSAAALRQRDVTRVLAIIEEDGREVDELLAQKQRREPSPRLCVTDYLRGTITHQSDGKLSNRLLLMSSLLVLAHLQQDEGVKSGCSAAELAAVQSVASFPQVMHLVAQLVHVTGVGIQRRSELLQMLVAASGRCCASPLEQRRDFTRAAVAALLSQAIVVEGRTTAACAVDSPYIEGSRGFLSQSLASIASAIGSKTQCHLTVCLPHADIVPSTRGVNVCSKLLGVLTFVVLDGSVFDQEASKDQRSDKSLMAFAADLFPSPSIAHCVFVVPWEIFVGHSSTPLMQSMLLDRADLSYRFVVLAAPLPSVGQTLQGFGKTAGDDCGSGVRCCHYLEAHLDRICQRVERPEVVLWHEATPSPLTQRTSQTSCSATQSFLPAVYGWKGPTVSSADVLKKRALTNIQRTLHAASGSSSPLSKKGSGSSEQQQLQRPQPHKSHKPFTATTGLRK